MTQRLGLEQNNIVPGCRQIDPQNLCRFQQFCHGAFSGDQFLEQFFPLSEIVFLHLLQIPLSDLNGYALLLDLRRQFIQFRQQFLTIDGFGQILGHSQLDSFLGIFEFLVTGQNNDFCVRKLLADQTAQFQAVHKRHPDIGDHDIRTQFLDHGIGQFSVTGLPTELIAMSLPVNIIFDSFTDDKFILHQKHF